MANIKVKLRDSSSIFRDASQNITITGKKELTVKRTETIMDAIRGGALLFLGNVSGTKSKESTNNVEETEIEEVEETTENLESDSLEDNATEETVINDNELSLGDLRAKYPEIDAPNKKQFLEKLES